LNRERVLILARATDLAPIARHHRDGLEADGDHLGRPPDFTFERDGRARRADARQIWTDASAATLHHVALTAVALVASPEQLLPTAWITPFRGRCCPGERAQIREDHPHFVFRHIDVARHLRSGHAARDGAEKLRVATAVQPLTGRQIRAAIAFCIHPVADGAATAKHVAPLLDRFGIVGERVGLQLGLRLRRDRRDDYPGRKSDRRRHEQRPPPKGRRGHRASL
jgi:hypothetical protein